MSPDYQPRRRRSRGAEGSDLVSAAISEGAQRPGAVSCGRIPSVRERVRRALCRGSLHAGNAFDGPRKVGTAIRAEEGCSGDGQSPTPHVITVGPRPARTAGDEGPSPSGRLAPRRAPVPPCVRHEPAERGRAALGPGHPADGPDGPGPLMPDRHGPRWPSMPYTAQDSERPIGAWRNRLGSVGSAQAARRYRVHLTPDRSRESCRGGPAPAGVALKEPGWADRRQQSRPSSSRQRHDPHPGASGTTTIQIGGRGCAIIIHHTYNLVPARPSTSIEPEPSRTLDCCVGPTSSRSGRTLDGAPSNRHGWLKYW